MTAIRSFFTAAALCLSIGGQASAADDVFATDDLGKIWDNEDIAVECYKSEDGPFLLLSPAHDSNGVFMNTYDVIQYPDDKSTTGEIIKRQQSGSAAVGMCFDLN